MTRCRLSLKQIHGFFSLFVQNPPVLFSYSNSWSGWIPPPFDDLVTSTSSAIFELFLKKLKIPLKLFPSYSNGFVLSFCCFWIDSIFCFKSFSDSKIWSFLLLWSENFESKEDSRSLFNFCITASCCEIRVSSSLIFWLSFFLSSSICVISSTFSLQVLDHKIFNVGLTRFLFV